MKDIRSKTFAFFLFAILLSIFSNYCQAQFPCNPGDSVEVCCGADSGDFGYSWDLGSCDTLRIFPWPRTDTCFVNGADTICINDPGKKFPCFLYLSLLVTHDSNTFYWGDYNLWVQDSIMGFVIPLAWTHTNPAAYCSLSDYWNRNAMDPYDVRFPRSIWRHFHPSELDSNRMAWLTEQGEGLEWTAVLNMASDSSWYYFNSNQDSAFVPPHMWMGLLPLSSTNRKWWEAEKTLLATLTFRIEDTMYVCIDSTWWPPSSRLKFIRYGAKGYIPRDNLPFCISVPPPWIEVTSPNGGEIWCPGSIHDITWVSENFTGDVKIEYSIDSGNHWLEITPRTENSGTYSWEVENMPSPACFVRISDALDADPYDKSDGSFTIVEQLIGLTFPDGGETLIVDSTYEITWTSSCVNIVKIEYSPDMVSWFSIVDSTESDGSYFWKIPDTPSDSGWVRICDIDSMPGDTSETDFSIVRPDLIITVQPETLMLGAEDTAHCQVILNSLYGFSATCSLSVSDLPLGTAGFFDDSIVKYPYTDTSTLTITTTDTTPGGEYSIVISATELGKKKKGIEHEAKVTLIVMVPYIQITSPHGGENWCVGKTEQITWRCGWFSGPLVKIEYSTDAGIGWLPIEGTQNNGIYLWSIPDTPTDSCLVRVSDDEDGNPSDESDGFFTIFLAGDANSDEGVNSADIVYLINYLFVYGPAPQPLDAGDANCDGKINSADVTYLINYLFIGGPPPDCW
jgi:hypothetical protein